MREIRTYDDLKELIESPKEMQYEAKIETRVRMINTIRQMSDECVIDLTRTCISELGHRLAGVSSGTSDESEIDLAVRGMQDCVEMIKVSLKDG